MTSRYLTRWVVHLLETDEARVFLVYGGNKFGAYLRVRELLGGHPVLAVTRGGSYDRKRCEYRIQGAW